MIKHLLLMTKQLPLFIPINAYCNEQNWFVHNTTSSDEALTILKTQTVAAVLWDTTSVDFNETLTAISHMREKVMIPIIMLAKERNPEQMQQLFHHHVDDYLVEPFDFPEIIAILKQRFWLYDQTTDANTESPDTAHQTVEPSAPKQLTFNNLTIDLQHYRVLRDNQDLGLTPKEFKLLHYLIQHPNQVLSREQLLQGVWDYDILGNSRMVDIHISHLRDKIEPDPQNPIWLQTVRGFGYVLKN